MRIATSFKKHVVQMIYLAVGAEQLTDQIGDSVLCVPRGHVNSRVDRVLNHLEPDFSKHSIHKTSIAFI